MINSVAKTSLDIAEQAARDVAVRAESADKLAKLPAEDITALHDSGYLLLSIPKSHGGHGASLRDCVAASVALAKGSASTALVAGMQIHTFGNEREVMNWPEEKFAWLCNEAANNRALMNSIASEPALGSPSRGGSYQTVADLVGNEFVINGHKTWSSGGAHLTHLLTRVGYEDSSAVVAIPGNSDGISWDETWRDSLCLRASDSHDVLFNDVRVPEENLLLIGKGKGLTNVWFPMIMSSIYLGSALAARDAVIRFSLDRVPSALGKSIATLPKIQRQIGEIDIALQAARALLFEVAGDWTEDDADRAHFYTRVAAAKTLVNEVANEVTDKALRIAGGQSITKSLSLERHFRDVRAGSMQPPSGDTALEMVGRAAISEMDSNAD